MTSEALKFLDKNTEENRLINSKETDNPITNNINNVNNNNFTDQHEFESLEYEEDVYYRNAVPATPSFDDIDDIGNDLSDSDEIVVHCWRGSSGDIEEIIVDASDNNSEFLHQYSLSVHDADFSSLIVDEDDDYDDKAANFDKFRDKKSIPVNYNSRINSVNKNSSIGKELVDNTIKKRKSVRLIFQDLSKPYLAKIGNSQNYKKILEMVKGEEASPHSGDTLSSPTDDFLARGILEERELRREEWTAELAKVEEEIQTLRHVLASKVKVSQELKRKLGIGAWKELTDDVNQGLRNVKESQVFQKTESVIKTTAEKTTSILGGFSSGITMKIGQMRNSESFRSLEERVGSAYENVKTKVVPSRSNSTQSFDEALKEAEATRRASAAPSATSPTIPEDKLLS